jgi:hypothetical protein
LDEDPSLALALGIPGEIYEAKIAMKMQHVQYICVRPFRAPARLKVHGHAILRGVVDQHEQAIRGAIDMGSLIVNRILACGLSRGYSDFAKMAAKKWPRPAIKPIKTRTTIHQELKQSPRRFLREMIERYYGLVEEVAFDEICYICEILHVTVTERDRPMLEFQEIRDCIA